MFCNNILSMNAEENNSEILNTTEYWIFLSSYLRAHQTNIYGIQQHSLSSIINICKIHWPLAILNLNDIDEITLILDIINLKQTISNEYDISETSLQLIQMLIQKWSFNYFK